MSDTTTHRWMLQRETARYLRLSVRHVQQLTTAGKIPHVRLGPRTVRYDRLAIDEWLIAASKKDT